MDAGLGALSPQRVQGRALALPYLPCRPVPGLTAP